MQFLRKTIEQIIQFQKNKKSWWKVVRFLECITVFVTTYALILPAISLSQDTARQQDGIVLEGVVAKQYLIFNDDLALADVQFQGAHKVSAVALKKGNDDLVKMINEIIKKDTESGQFEKWVDEYSRIAVEKAKK